MKAAIVAAAAAVFAGGASAARHHHHHRHAHRALFDKRGGVHNSDTDVCVPSCTTIYSTITGDLTSKYTPRPVGPSLDGCRAQR